MKIREEANKDLWDGAGRIFISDFLKNYGVNLDAFIEALGDMQQEYKVTGNIAIIYFVPRERRLATRIKEYKPRFKKTK
jgi:hypothetical protein